MGRSVRRITAALRVGPAAGNIGPVSGEAPTPNGDAHRYYSFNAYQNGATIRVIVLDNSRSSLQESAAAAGEPRSAQLEWLERQLGQAASEEQAIGQRLPIVVITALPLRPNLGASDGEAVAALLARHGVAAIFTTSTTQRDEHHFVPENPRAGEGQIMEYEGASLSYQQPGNNGVLWYFVTVNTVTGEVQVGGVPVVSSLALKPLNGTNVARSQTLQFEAVARRPAGSLATLEEQSPPAPGYENYVAIPASGCAECVSPSYAFTSSEPAIGTFVEPSGPGSPYPKLDSHGHPIPSATSGLFCGFNPGTTIVSITTGLLTYSEAVTVQEGSAGPPCGSVEPPGGYPQEHIVIPHAQSSLRPAAVPPPPPSPLGGALPTNLALVPPVPAPPPAPTPAPPVVAKPPPPKPPAPAPPAPVEPTVVPLETFTATPAILPTPTPPIEPIPPGASGYAQSPSAAERREKAEKEASQSAFTARPPLARPLALTSASPSSSESPWYYWGVGAAALLVMFLTARGLRSTGDPARRWSKSGRSARIRAATAAEGRANSARSPSRSRPRAVDATCTRRIQARIGPFTSDTQRFHNSVTAFTNKEQRSSPAGNIGAARAAENANHAWEASEPGCESYPLLAHCQEEGDNRLAVRSNSASDSRYLDSSKVGTKT